ncbi:unnamed protein product [Triticum turgidum subsp. durum]|uniref:DUF6598 domain-containing protein n=1 Tax=Triticum turgidum subsp. durum TaxID=4567 RepID=A0A9R0SRI1_TRITD|nr:unnamed protein product [Triticum turgidum subsp. durum]
MGGGVKAKEEYRLGSSKVSPAPAEEAPAAAAAKGKKSRAKKAASRIDLDKAEAVVYKADMKARESARVAKAKAEEAEEAARIAKAKAEEAEEAARAAKADAEAVAKAREAADEAMLLYEKEMEWAQCEEELNASMFRGRWNQQHARHGATFLEITSIPPMRYTYPTPEEKVYIKTAETLQIVSLKIVSINDDSLRWPLQVCLVQDPYLALTGPSRAVAVSMEPSHIEVSLKVKGTTKSDDKDLSELVLNFRSGCVLSDVYPSRISTIEFKYGHIMCAVEATIRIKVTGGSWPDGFRGMFTAYNTGADDLKVKLLDFGDGGLPVGADGMVKLSRSVVSVDLEELLKVSAMAYPINDDEVADSSEVALKPEMAGITPPGFVLTVGSCSMEW